MLLVGLMALLILALGGGGWGYSRYGYVGWSPVGLIVALLLVLWFSGNLHI
jgi:hypothetical protein